VSKLTGKDVGMKLYGGSKGYNSSYEIVDGKLERKVSN
jgi:hypothetical protein